MSFVRSRADFIVIEEGTQKIIYDAADSAVRSSETPKRPRNGKRERRSIQPLLRWFHQHNRQTCSVFTAKQTDKTKLSLIRAVGDQVAKDLGYNDGHIDMHVIGVAEASEGQKQPHAHFCVFKVMSGEPHPLTDEEAHYFIGEVNRWLFVWKRLGPDVLPSKVMRKAYMRKAVEELRSHFVEYWEGNKKVIEPRSASAPNRRQGALYAVPFASKDGKNFQSGIAGYGLGYCVKTIVNAQYVDKFVASIGITPALETAKAQRIVKVKSKSVVDAVYATYNMRKISMLAYEAEKQLRYRKAKEVACYIKHNRVIVSFTIKKDEREFMLLSQNEYLLIGLELLRRYLKDFDGASVLRRACVKVCKALCSQYTELPTDTLVSMARDRRQAIVWRAETKAKARAKAKERKTK